MFKLYYIFFLVLLSCCSTKAPQQASVLCDLYESSRIIKELIDTKSLKKILDDIDDAGLEKLILNFSPAQIALEAEALSQEGDVALIFYNNKTHYQPLHKELCDLQQTYSAIKFIEINSEELFNIAEQSEVTTFPTIIIINDRKEICRFEDQPPQELMKVFKDYLARNK